MTYKKVIVVFIIFMGFYFVTKKIRSRVLGFNIMSEIALDSAEHDFGKITQNNKVSIYFKYKNTSNKSLTIYSVSSRCGCTIPNWSRTQLSPNEIDSFLVRYDAKELGYFAKEIVVISNAKSSPDMLYIFGEVISE